MSDREPWTIERICDALGHPKLAQGFLAEINKAPAHELLAVFAKWQAKADSMVAASVRGREIVAAEAEGREAPGTWIDITDRVHAEAARGRGAA